MDITRYMPCKKKTRRSTRLEEKDKEEQKEKTIKQAPLGYLDMLPLELKFFLFKYLSSECRNLN